MRAINLSAREIGDLKELPKDCVLISINEEYGDLYPLQFSDESRILRQRFSDIHAAIESKGRTYNPINARHADEIIRFCEDNRYKYENFLVHCAAGISRSSAVCLFLSLVYGADLKENFWHLSEPNPYVLGLLLVRYKNPLLTIHDDKKLF